MDKKNRNTDAMPELSGDSREQEQERIRSSNDRDQELEREGVEAEHNRGYDEAVRGQRSDSVEREGIEREPRRRPDDDAIGMGDDVDPDSAESEVDRDDTIAE